MSLSRILSRLTSSALLAAVGISAMFVSVDIPSPVTDVSRGNTAILTHAIDIVNAEWNDMAGHSKDAAPITKPSDSSPSAADTAKSSIDKWGETVMQFANFAVEVLYMFLIPLTMLAGWLLSPDWTFGDIFGLRAVIHNLWIFISNVVYIVFAFSLVAVAFVNIYSGGGNFAIKKALPRFLVGIIIVPFTWFIVSATLSVSNLLTASVLRLPYEMMSNTQRSYVITIPKVCTLNFKEEDAKKEGKTFECSEGSDGTHQVLLGDFISSGNGAYNMLSAYAYSIFSIQTLKSITTDIKLQSVLNGGIQLIVGLISFCVFWLLIIALCFALFARAFKMWIMAIFSPLFGLFYFFDGKVMGKFQKENWFEFVEFLGLAMVPVYVSAALSFGLLFLTMTQNVDLSERISASSYWDSVKQDGDGNANFALGQAGDKTPFMTIVAKGVPLYANDAAKVAGTGIKLGQNAIGRIIVSVLGLVVLWMAVMAALKGSKVTEAAVSPFEKFGKSIADMAKAIPQHIPIIPTKQWGMSAAGLDAFGSGMKTGVTNTWTEDFNRSGSEFGAKLMGKEMNKWFTENNNILRQIQQDWLKKEAFGKAQENFLKNLWIKDVAQMSESQKNQLSQFIQSTHSDHFKAQFKDPSKKQAIADKVKTNPVEALNEFNLALENRTERVGDLKGDITYTKSSFNDYLKSLHADEGDTQSTTTPESTPIEKLMKDITVPATWDNWTLKHGTQTYNLTKHDGSWQMKSKDFEKLLNSSTDSGITKEVLEKRLKDDKNIDIFP